MFNWVVIVLILI